MAEKRSPSPSPPLPPNSLSSVMNGKPDLKTVCAIVRTDRWYQLGLQLEVDDKKLQEIDSERSDAQDKRTQMFRVWISSQPGASHNQLVEALRLKVIGEDRMAQEYEEKVKNEASKTTETTQTGMYHINTNLNIQQKFQIH